MHRGIHACMDASIEVITEVLLEVKVTKVARRTISSRSWRSEAWIATPLMALACVADILCQCRVEIGANLGARRDLSCLLV